MEQDGAFIMTNCTKPKALPGNMDSEQKQVDVGYVEPLGNKYVLLQLMCLDLRGFLYRLMFFFP